MKSFLPEANFAKSWQFPAASRAALQAYACQFDKPFWAHFDVTGSIRRIHLPPYAGGVLITETLHEHQSSGYRYSMTGVPNVSDYQGWFSVEDDGPHHVRLTWKISFRYQGGPKALVAVSRVFANTTSAMAKALRQQLAG